MDGTDETDETRGATEGGATEGVEDEMRGQAEECGGEKVAETGEKVGWDIDENKGAEQSLDSAVSDDVARTYQDDSHVSQTTTKLSAEEIIIENNYKHMNGRNIYLGSALALAGILWLLSSMNLLSPVVFRAIFTWPVLLVVIGGYFLILKKWLLGWVLLVIGVVCSLQHWFGIDLSLTQIVLPTILIAAGIAIAIQKK